MTEVEASVLWAAVAAFCIDVGLILLKQEGDRLPPLRWQTGLASVQAFCKDPLWLAGLFLQPIGYACYILALEHGPLSIVQPIMSAGVLLFVAFAALVLQEPIGVREWVAICAIAVGVGLLGLSLSPSTDLQPARINGSSVIFFSALILGLVWLAGLGMRRRDRGLWLSIESGLFLGLASVYAKGLAVAISRGPSRETWAVLAFNPYLSLTLLGNLIGFALLLGAFYYGRAGIVLPLSAALSNLVPIAGGMVALGEHPPPHGAMVLRLAAIVLTIGGAAILSRYSPSPEVRDVGRGRRRLRWRSS